jgi:hypothetical protein
MTLYRKSRLFMAWVLLVFVTFPFWMIKLLKLFGEAGGIAGAVFWLSHGAASMFLFRCPECGLSPFLSKKGFFAWASPWPKKDCGHCGHDHTRLP